MAHLYPLGHMHAPRHAQLSARDANAAVTNAPSHTSPHTVATGRVESAALMAATAAATSATYEGETEK